MKRDAKRSAAGHAVQKLAGGDAANNPLAPAALAVRAAVALLGPRLFFTAVELSLRLAGHGHSSSGLARDCEPCLTKTSLNMQPAPLSQT
jgi:hypothetical protein